VWRARLEAAFFNFQTKIKRERQVMLDWNALCLTFQVGKVYFECGVQNSQQYIHTERDRQHFKRECSILNEVFKLGNITHSSTGVGRGGLFNFQT
jgi:hypothetical protein